MPIPMMERVLVGVGDAASRTIYQHGRLQATATILHEVKELDCEKRGLTKVVFFEQWGLMQIACESSMCALEKGMYSLCSTEILFFLKLESVSSFLLSLLS